jgi:hypothetical protein
VPFLVLVVYFPLHYHIDVGVQEGYGGDLPHLHGFNTAEHSEHGSYRWTKDNATILLPGVGQRPFLLRLTFLPLSEPTAAVGPQAMDLRVAGEPLATLPVRREGTHATLIIPAQLVRGGTFRLTIHTTTFTPPDDPRQLGTPLAAIELESLPTSFPVSPDWSAVGLWVGALLLLQATLVISLGRTPAFSRWNLVAMRVAVLLVGIAAWLDPPRWAYGARPALVAVLLCLILSLVLRSLLPPLAASLRIPLAPATTGWLIVIIVAAFGLRYGGRIYPDAMHGDIFFHTNRFSEAIGQGNLFLLARNRGVDFPYPPGPYLTLAPLALFNPHPPSFLPLVAALAEGLGAALVYTLVALALLPQTSASNRPGRFPAFQKTALLAAAIYVFTAAGFMITWWSFTTHIATQFATLLLITVMLFFACCDFPSSPLASRFSFPVPTIAVLFVLFVLICGVFLGHFGFFINTTLMGGMVLLVLWLLAKRGNIWARQHFVLLLLGGGGALLAALLLFYSAYLPMVVSHMQTALTEGLPELARREPVSRERLLYNLWHLGFIEHFGFFPLLLLPLGMWHLLASGRNTTSLTRNTKPGFPDLTMHVRRARLALFSLMACSVLVSSGFALLPFLTRSGQNTRWLMFSAWAIAVGAALGTRLLLRYGRAGRLVVLTMAGFVLWNTALFWLEPLAWRIRPPEPF